VASGRTAWLIRHREELDEADIDFIVPETILKRLGYRDFNGCSGVNLPESDIFRDEEEEAVVAEEEESWEEKENQIRDKGNEIMRLEMEL
jgi:hypothetical protein